MIRALSNPDRRRLSHLAHRQWRTVFVPIAILNVTGFGRSVVAMRRLETRWSDSHRRRLWRVPLQAGQGAPVVRWLKDRWSGYLALVFAPESPEERLEGEVI